MPLYEYECEKCGDVFEVIQRFADAPLEVHEKCGGPVHRLVSAPALQFKGSGWYVTDSRSASSTTSSANGAPSPTPAAKTDEGSSSSSAPAASSSSAEASKPAEASSTPAAKD